jgi:class 3 adenylate cyclase
VAAAKLPLRFGIGIASGDVLAGRLGTPQRSASVCVGATMRRAAELQAQDDPLATGHRSRED